MAAIRRALVVEDDAGCRLAVEKRLRLDLFQTRGAVSAGEALAVLQQWRADLVVLDLALGAVSGLDLLRLARSDRALAGSALLVITNSRDLDLIGRAYALGAGACLTKPYQTEILSALARNLVSGQVAL